MATTPFARPSIASPAVRSAIALIRRSFSTGVGGDVREGPFVELGGTMTLNLHLADLGVVVRIHAGNVDRAWVAALRRLRARLADEGVVVATPVRVGDVDVVELDGHLLEVETYVPAPSSVVLSERGDSSPLP